MTTTRSRLRSILISCAVAVAVPAFLPGTALAHGDHGDVWVDCSDSATAQVEEGSGSGEGGGEAGGDEPVSSDDAIVEGPDVVMCSAVPDGAVETYSGGMPGRGGTRAGHGGAGVGDVCPGGGGGVGGFTGGVGARAPYPDSSSADLDVDSGSADIGGDLVGGSGTMASAGWARTGVRRVAAAGCVRPVARIGGLGGEVVAPTRIDAGAGATAAVGGAPLFGLFAAGGIAVTAVARRRRRP